MKNDEVKISKVDIDVLKSVYQINQTLKVVGGSNEIRSKNRSNTQAVIANLESVFPRTFCIYDIREFIAVLSIVENPILDFKNDKYIIIKSEDGKQKLKYAEAAENLINSHFIRQPSLPSVDFEITVSEKQLKAVMEAAYTLKLAFVGFVTENDKVLFTAFNTNNGSGDVTNGFSIEIGESTNTFELFYKTELLKILDGVSTFSICSRGMSRVMNGAKEFWISLEAGITFN